MRGKNKWRCDTMECGGQCVLMAGVTLLLMLFVVNWALTPVSFTGCCNSCYLSLSINRGCIHRRWMGKFSNTFNSITCNEAHPMLLQCVNEQSIGVDNNCGENNIAGVICEMPSPDYLSTSVSAWINCVTSVWQTCFKLKANYYRSDVICCS